MSRFNPDWRVPPGHILKDWMDEHGIDVGEFAELANLQRTWVRDIIRGVAALTPHVARALEQATGVPEHLWLNLETEYRKPIHV